MSLLLHYSFSDLPRTLIKDRFSLKRDLQLLASLLRGNQNDDTQEKVSQLSTQLHIRFEQSIAAYQRRMDLPIHIEFPNDLPITQRLDDIAELLNQHALIIVAGETGSGKTTQLAKLCLQLGRGRAGMIAHTQPRRLAASSVAARIAEELKVNLGQEVGFQVRFTDYSTDKTLLKLMTDGVLLAEIQHDRFLQKYDTIIIDEAHERSLNIDFLLGYLKTLLPKRPDLKVIITSATIDVERFSAHFDLAPIVSVSGRSHEVEMVYRPFDNDENEAPLANAILSVMEEIIADEIMHPIHAGDILVFLPGEHVIREVSLLLRRAQLPATEILPLYARLTAAEHNKIFHLDTKKAGRRVILATNVAETSLTVPGIRYVIDSGLARMSRYSHRSKVQRLPIEKISQASANQRAGRCGRISSGVCFRLYAEDDYLQREAFTQPEIQRTNLAAVILQMQMMKLGRMEDFPFLEMPDSRLINDGVKQLVELGALNSDKSITALGKQLGMLPLDPRFSAMLVQAHKQRSLKEVLVIVAALSIQDPRENPADKRDAAREQHQRFAHIDSDFLTLWALWQYVEEQRQQLSKPQFAKKMAKEFLSPQRLREWRETHSQLKRICDRLALKENSDPANYDSIHKSLLSGLITQVAVQRDNKVFEGTRSRQFKIFPASVLFKKPPKWLMAAELLETSQLFAHIVAKIEPEWVIALAPHIVKHHYSEPHWSIKQGQVMAYEKTSLYGLVLSENQRVSYAKIDAKQCREIFIRSALVEEQLRSEAAFFLHNKNTKQKIIELEEKTRRRDLLANDDVVYDFYDGLIADNITSFASFEAWRKKAEHAMPHILFAPESLFKAETAESNAHVQFPDQVEWQGVNYTLEYCFDPTHIDDGLSVIVPAATLNRLPRFRFEWLVPGMLADKCEELIKSLPKAYRKSLVPIPHAVKQLLPLLQIGDDSLIKKLEEAILKVFFIKIPQDAWQPDKLAPFYFANFCLVDENKHCIAKSRDLALLIKEFGYQVQQALNQSTTHQDNQKSLYQRWEFGDIAKEKIIKQSSAIIHSYPALSDADEGVVITLTDYAHIQESVHRRGLIKLAMLTLPQQLKYLRKELLKGNELQLQLTEEYDKTTLLNDIINAAFNHTFFENNLPYTEVGFQEAIQKNSAMLTPNAMAIEKLVRLVLASDFKVRRLLAAMADKPTQTVKHDIEQQRAALVYVGFIFATPIAYLFELPRYYNAMVCRLERLQGQVPKDLTYTNELQPFITRMNILCKDEPLLTLLPELVTYRWMLEEYRVSIFAQQLKTKMPISIKRLEKQWLQVIEAKRNTLL